MLDTSSVHRRLDSKLKIMGLEALDLLFVLLFAAIMNLVFGQTSMSILMVFIVPIVMGGILFFIKRNKPDGYLAHFLKYNLEAGYLSSGEEGLVINERKGKIYEA